MLRSSLEERRIPSCGDGGSIGQSTVTLQRAIPPASPVAASSNAAHLRLKSARKSRVVLSSAVCGACAIKRRCQARAGKPLSQSECSHGQRTSTPAPEVAQWVTDPRRLAQSSRHQGSTLAAREQAPVPTGSAGEEAK